MIATATEPILRVDGLCKQFTTKTGPLTVLSPTSFEMQQSELVSIVGPSGCGKSTLLRIIAGLGLPSAGTIEWPTAPHSAGGEPLPDLGFVFQDPTLMPWSSALKNVMLPLTLAGVGKAEAETRSAEMLALVGLKGFESAYPRALSGGMQQRVSISRALVSDPRILLMDEPFGALDAMTREELSFELLRIWEERKKTVLFVTHSIPEAVLLANRVVVMTPRPARVAKIIEVNLPRPRTLAMEFSSEFRQATDEIRELIYQKRQAT